VIDIEEHIDNNNLAKKTSKGSQLVEWQQEIFMGGKLVSYPGDNNQNLFCGENLVFRKNCYSTKGGAL
jgi:hypothetical protein